VLLLRGEYTLTEPVVLDGQDGNMIWKSDEADSALIIGGQHIANLTADPAGIWHAQPGRRFEQLYVNSQRVTRARLPAKGFFKMEGVRQEELPDDKARITVKFSTADIVSLASNWSSNLAALRGLELLVFHKWDTSRYRVSSVDAAAGTLTVEGKLMQPWNPWNTESRFILDNCGLVQPLDPGTWFLDQQAGLNFCPRPGDQIGKADFIAPTM